MQFTTASAIPTSALAVAARQGPSVSLSDAAHADHAPWRDFDPAPVFPGEQQNDISSISPPQGYYCQCYLYHNHYT
ncbi:hypothetical protein PsYK624_013800 [Phanerochaete sordida]|uniref:Uncharacterized protein n=1 Tax=Phanerochaete sordida TaxID=48140 RepID=A0A9P3L7Q0_9APHY|nr:hypothetical protein PsYK624_013800 [Phanerochaete sordida]